MNIQMKWRVNILIEILITSTDDMGGGIRGIWFCSSMEN